MNTKTQNPEHFKTDVRDSIQYDKYAQRERLSLNKREKNTHTFKINLNMLQLHSFPIKGNIEIFSKHTL